MKKTTLGILITPTIDKYKRIAGVKAELVDMSILADGQTQLERIYGLLECRNIDVIRTSKGDIYIDDEGLFVTNNPVISFKLDNKPIQLAGTTLFSNGADDEGETLWFDKNKVADLTKITDIQNALNDFMAIGFVQ